MEQGQREQRGRGEDPDPRVERDCGSGCAVDDHRLTTAGRFADEAFAEPKPPCVARCEARARAQLQSVLPLVVLVERERAIAGLVGEDSQHLRARARRPCLVGQREHHARPDTVDPRGDLELPVLALHGRLGGLAGADVAYEPCEEPPILEPHLADREIERHARPVLADADDLATSADDLGAAGLLVALQMAVVRAAIRLRHQELDVLAQDLRGRIAEDRLRASAERGEGALLVDHHHTVEHRVEHRVGARLQAGPLGCGALGLGDVPHDGRRTDHPRIDVHDRRDRDRSLEGRAVAACANRLEVLDSLATPDARQELGLLTVAVGRYEPRHRLADDLPRRGPKQALRGGVPARDDPVERLADDRVVGGGDDARRPRLHLARPADLRDVFDPMDDADQRAARVEDWCVDQAPVALLEAAALGRRPTNVVLLDRHRVRPARRADLIEGGAQAPAGLGRSRIVRVLGKDVEHASPEHARALRHRRAQVRVADAEDGVVEREDEVAARGGLEEQPEVRVVARGAGRLEISHSRKPADFIRYPRIRS